MISIYHDTRKKSSTGRYPLKIRVSYEAGYFYIPTGIYVSPDNFDKSLPLGSQIVLTPTARMMNSALKLKYYEIEESITRLSTQRDLSRIPLSEMKSMFSDKKDAGSTFLDCMNSKIKQCKKKKTREAFEYTVNKIRSFDDSPLSFEAISYQWLKKFDAWMAESICTNTRAIVMRNIRTVFNEAIDDEIISPAIYPFRKFKIKKEATIKRSMSIEDLRLMRTYPVEPFQEKYRDMFMLIFYLRGINIVDLTHLTEIHNGYIDYKRSKTGKLYSIKVEPEAMEIINKYRGTTYLLDILDHYKDHEDYFRRLNRELKHIGPYDRKGKGGKKIFKPLFPSITSYWARHTWATIAAELDIPKETIAAGLGHGSNSVTDIYINFNQKKVDEANRKVIDYLLQSL